MERKIEIVLYIEVDDRAVQKLMDARPEAGTVEEAAAREAKALLEEFGARVTAEGRER